MTDNINESSSGSISENNANSIASNKNDSSLVPNAVMQASSQTADVPSGNVNDVNKTVTSSQQPPTPVTDNATPIVQSPLPMMSAAVTPTVLRAPLQPVHLQPVLQSYIAPHLVISSPTPVSGLVFELI